MTHEEKLKAVTADIRKKLPRLMELGKGCLIKHGGKIWELLDYVDKETIAGFRIGVLTHEVTLFRLKKLKGVEEYEIIGKEPTILDCLEWINLKANGYVYYITDTSFVRAECQMGDLSALRGCKIDLSKPLLKDNEELITFLYGLL